ncbi:MAG: radical SAM protein [Candidatus Sumerlaeia bacterium]
MIVPPTGKYIREDRCQTPIDNLKTVALRPPIDLMYAAAGCEQGGAECRLTDYPAENLGWSDLEAQLRDFQPDGLVLSITTPSLHDDLQAASLAKRVNPSIITMAKGAHFNTLDVRTLREYPDLDLVFRGEYEEACAEVAQGRPFESILGITWRRPADGQIVQNPPRPLPRDIDGIPFPARHLVKNHLYVRPDTGRMQTTIVTNRGCPFSCTYCLANQVSGLRNRLRSPENVVAELKECIERFGIRSFLFRSDLFTQKPDWVIALSDLIIREGLQIDWACNSRVDTVREDMLRRMKAAGCWIIAFGVESGDQDTLDRIRKKARVEQAFEAVRLCRRTGIRSSVYLLFGLPWDSPHSLQANIDFGKKLNPDFLEIFFVYPFPGTEMYRQAVELGLLKDGEIPRNAYGEPAMPTLHMSIEDLRQWRRRALRQFYLRPRYIARTLRQAGSPAALLNYMRLGVAQLMDIVRPVSSS